MINKFKNCLRALSLTAVLLLTSCASQPFMDSLNQENYETIRKSTYLEGSSEIVTREEFEGYKSEIVKAIKGESTNIARIDNSVINQKIVVTPYKMTVEDLSPDVRIYIDDKKIDKKSENGMELVVLPGPHKIKYELITPYYKEDKEKTIDTSSFKDGKYKDKTGFGFKDFTIMTEDVGSFLVINDNSYMALQKGPNVIKNMPSANFPMYSKAENDENFVSETVNVDGSMKSITLKLTKRVNNDASLNTVNTKPVVITAPKKQGGQMNIPQENIPGLVMTEKGMMSNIGTLGISKDEENKMLDGILNNLEALNQGLDSDISNGGYGNSSNYIQSGSNLEFFIKQKIANEHEKPTGYNYNGMNIGQIVFSTKEEGYVDFTINIEETKEGVKVKDRQEKNRYYFIYEKDGSILFTRYEKIS